MILLGIQDLYKENMEELSKETEWVLGKDKDNNEQEW